MCITHADEAAPAEKPRRKFRPDGFDGWWGLWSADEERWIHHSFSELARDSTPVYQSRDAAAIALSHLPSKTKERFAPARLDPDGYFPLDDPRGYFLAEIDD